MKGKKTALAAMLFLAGAASTPCLADASSDLQNCNELYRSGKTEQAREGYTKLVADYPSSDLLPNALHGLGMTYLSEKQYDRAMEQFQRVVSEYPSSSAAIEDKMRIGECYQNLKKYPEAIEAYKKLTGASTDSKDYIVMLTKYKLGECYRETKAWDSGIELYQQLIRDFPADADKHMYDLGTCYKGKGDYQAAIDTFSGVSAKQPSIKMDAVFQVSDCLNGWGKYEEQLAYLDKVEVDHPDYREEVLFRRAMLRADHMSQYEEAIDELQTLVNDYPKAAKVVNAKAFIAGLTLNGLKDTSTARELLEAFISEYPDYDIMNLVKHDMATCYYTDGIYELAGNWFEESYEAAGPEGWKPFLLYMTADSYARVPGMEKKAIEIWQKLMDLHPNDLWVPIAAKRCKRIERRLQ